MRIPILARFEALNRNSHPTGYFSRANVAHCEVAGLTPHIATGREAHNVPLTERSASPPPCPEDADAVTRMAHRLQTPEGRALYARRKSTVETVFGIIKETMGFRRFHLRGLEAVRGEWTLTCLAWNIDPLAGESASKIDPPDVMQVNSPRRLDRRGDGRCW